MTTGDQPYVEFSVLAHSLATQLHGHASDKKNPNNATRKARVLTRSGVLSEGPAFISLDTQALKTRSILLSVYLGRPLPPPPAEGKDPNGENNANNSGRRGTQNGIGESAEEMAYGHVLINGETLLQPQVYITQTI